jgi:lysophospholipase L1-like esterase
VVVLWGGFNDVALSGEMTAPWLLDGLRAYADGARAAGLRVVVCTELPATNPTALYRGWNAIRTQLNGMIRAAGRALCDGVADLAADAVIGPDAASESATYYLDQVHLTDAGYARVAAVVADALARV